VPALLFAAAEFIQLVSTEANELATNEHKSTITPEYVMRALVQLGFEEWADDVKHSHEQFKTEAKREWQSWQLYAGSSGLEGDQACCCDAQRLAVVC
jgi:Holliday junction resolvasome RuvABC DNA-binding subunit